MVVEGTGCFELLITRAKKGIYFSEKAPEIKTVFILVGTRDERNFHLRALSAIAQIVQNKKFEENWIMAKNEQAIKDIILLSTRKR